MGLTNFENNFLLLANGNTKLPSQIEVGDDLLAWDSNEESYGVTTVKSVNRAWLENLLRIRVYAPCTYHLHELTLEQAVYVGRPDWITDHKGWTKAIHLEPEMKLMSKTDIKFSTNSKGEISFRSAIKYVGGYYLTYDFRCEPFYNFFIGEERLMVHM